MFKAGFICLLFLASFVPGPKVVAQPDNNHPNFSGTWMPDITKSDTTGSPAEDLEGLVIEHKDPELKIFHKTPVGDQSILTGLLTLYTDGRRK